MKCRPGGASQSPVGSSPDLDLTPTASASNCSAWRSHNRLSARVLIWTRSHPGSRMRQSALGHNRLSARVLIWTLSKPKTGTEANQSCHNRLSARVLIWTRSSMRRLCFLTLAGHNRLSARVLIWTLWRRRTKPSRPKSASQSPVGSSPDLDRQRIQGEGGLRHLRVTIACRLES